MIILGEVKGVYSANGAEKTLPRPRQDKLEFIEGYGIKNDKFADKDLEKTVMIVGQRAYDMAAEIGIQLESGSLGENILFDFDPHGFVEGTRFRLGDVLLEVTDDCSMCQHLSLFDSRLPKLLLNDRGRYCKILKSGSVEAGQRVTL